MRTAFCGEPNKWGIQRSKTQSRGFLQNLGNRKWRYRLTKAVTTGKRGLNGCRISVWNDHYRPEFQSNTIKYLPYSPDRPPHIPQTLIRLRPVFHPSAHQNRVIATCGATPAFPCHGSSRDMERQMPSNKWQWPDSGALKSGIRAEGEPGSEKRVKGEHTNDEREQDNARRRKT
jgi:hypothetical protein